MAAGRGAVRAVLVRLAPSAALLVCAAFAGCSDGAPESATQRRDASTSDAASAEADFRDRRLAILVEAQRRFDAGDAAGALADLRPYAALSDPDLVRLRDAASLVLLRQELVKSPEPSLERRAFIYSEIVRNNPNDARAGDLARELNRQVEIKRRFDEQVEADARRAAERAPTLRKQLTGVGGSHPAANDAIRERMKNPDSFVHVETTLIDLGQPTVNLHVKYRGTNSYNAVITSTAIVEMTPTGEVRSIRSGE